MKKLKQYWTAEALEKDLGDPHIQKRAIKRSPFSPTK
jgi:hypothetical protein